MSRKRGEWTQAKYDRYLKEGRGNGIREKYTPWIEVQDLSSKGRVSRDKGWKTNRLHHLFSDHETLLFYLLEWSDIVIDIREQFPLLDLELAQKIAAEIGVKYPVDSKRNGKGVRLIVCRLPVKSPWLNAIEPKWIHAKRAIVEPQRKLSVQELKTRVCDYFECPLLEPLAKKVS
jgi:hypothetical protein